MKEFFEKNKISIAIIIATFIIGGFIYLSKFTTSDFEKAEVKGIEGFLMANNLSCKILYSTNKKEISQTISLLDLNTDNPRALFESGTDSPMTKIYETDNLLVMQLVASGSGSIDTITLDKKIGAFARVVSGAFLGIYAGAYKGECK